MKLLVSVMVLFSFSSLFSQERSGSFELDAFTNPNCEVLSLLLDGTAIQLKSDPSAKALIVVTGRKDDLRKNLFTEGMIKTYFERYKFPHESWRVVRSGLKDALTVQSWIIPAGKELPSVTETDWSYELPPNTKPFIFYAGESFPEDICPPVSGLALLRDVLAANPRARTNVVLRAGTRTGFEKLKAQTLKKLTKDFSISPQQIKIYFKLRTRGDNAMEPEDEYWLLPPKKR